MKKISFVIPVFNSETTIFLVVSDIINICKKKFRYEIILVNDGSEDSSDKICRSLAKKNTGIVFINLTKNFGQHNAILTGLRFTTGEYIICLDDDLQTPPRESIKLIKTLEKDDYDVVFGNYKSKKHNKARNFFSQINGWMANILLDKPINIDISSYFIIKRYIVSEIIKFMGPEVYLPGLIMRITKKIGSVTIDHDKRIYGKSNYNVLTLFELWFVGFTNFSVKPLRICTLLGFLMSGVSFLLSFFIIIRRIIYPDIPVGWTSLVLLIILICGINLVFLGLIGEYVGKILLSSNHLPQSCIKELTKFKNKNNI